MDKTMRKVEVVRERERESSNLKTKKEIGITLIALIVTIIILLILAGITIATLFGENGILNRASTAKEETLKAQAEEEMKMYVLEIQTENQGNATLEQLVNLLRNKQDDYDVEIISRKQAGTVTITDTNNIGITNAGVIKVTNKTKYGVEVEIKDTLEVAATGRILSTSNTNTSTQDNDSNVTGNDDDEIVSMTRGELKSLIQEEVSSQLENSNINSAYDNSKTNLSATNFQDAIDELNTLLNSKTSDESVRKKAFATANGVMAEDTNLNDLKSPGLYFNNDSSYATTSKNYPENAVGGELLCVESWGTSTYKSLCQIYFGFTGNSSYVHLWLRHYSTSNGWSSWTRMHN